MDGAGGRRAVASFARLGATVILSSALTATVLTVLEPQPAHSEDEGIVIIREESAYPITVGDAPTTTFESEKDLIADYARLKRDLAELRHAIDYEAQRDGVSPSLHEWADRREPGTFGGGSKP